MTKPVSTAGPRRKSEPKAKPSLGSYKVQQRQIRHGGRTYHFVSYENPREEGPANAAAAVAVARRSTWFLMCAGTRVEVVPEIEDENPEETDRRLADWIEKKID